MRNSVFLDTHGWLAVLNATDALHVQALELWLELMRQGYQVVLTDWVVVEAGNGLARSRTKGRFVQVIEEMMDAPSVEVVVVDHNLLRRALANYAKYADKTWGLVDCASFIVMEERGITEAFTSDHDFEQAGFACLLTE
jgi:predicted nucleic acid-binding protein